MENFENCEEFKKIITSNVNVKTIQTITAWNEKDVSYILLEVTI